MTFRRDTLSLQLQQHIFLLKTISTNHFSTLLCTLQLHHWLLLSSLYPFSLQLLGHITRPRTLGKHNVMDSVLNRLAPTPTRATSAGAREPMEDTDASGTRKRPRLDSGDRTYRSMSADRLGATPTDSGLTKAPATPPHAHVSPQSSEKSGGLPSTNLTPRKEVTINVREPSTITSPTQRSTHLGDTPSLRGGGGGDDAPCSSNDPPNKLDSSPSNVISVTSSPPHSPEIEVAEIEDMNDDPGETRWKPLISATSLMDAKDIQQSVLEEFPYLGERGRNLRKTIAALAQTFEKGEWSHLTQG